MKFLILSLLIILNANASSVFDLEIRRADDSIYWVEHFRDRPSLDKWLNEEKTRSYWKQSYITNIIERDTTPPVRVKTPGEIERDNLKVEIKT